MEDQLSYEQFKRLYYLKTKYKFSITDILEEMENWKDLKKRKTIYKTFLTFLKNKIPGIVLK
jgi:acid stress-induced BolA-like protein IbaG/YrbA